MHPTHIDIPADKREKLITLLNGHLANIVDLSIQAKMAHWNVRGPHFIGLHELFDKVAETATADADEIAERIGQLGGIVVGNVQEVGKNTKLPVFSSGLAKDVEVLKALTESMAACTNAMRKDIETACNLGDQGTGDMLTDVVRNTDKNMWFVEAHLQ